MKPWFVYVLVSQQRTYTGVTTDPKRRLQQHNGLTPGGAKATRPWRPWSIGALFGPFSGRGEAQKIEAQVKKLRGLKRLTWTPDLAKS